MLEELTSEQRRQLIDTQQVYEAWLGADDERQRRFAGSMRWAERNGTEYLLRKFRQTENSLGPRSGETEKSFAAFSEGRERNKDVLVGLSDRLNRLAKVNVAMGLGRVPAIAARILRRCADTNLLGRQLLVVGTNALFAYEALAGVRIASGLTATGDIDLLFDSRRRISFVTSEKITQSGLIGVLRKVDRSFRPLQPRAFRATNRDGYLVDLIRPQARNLLKDNAPTSITSLEDGLDGAPMDGLQWPVNAPKTEAIAIDERGYPVRMPTIDPRMFALHKAWLARRPDRSAVKATRDREQAEAAALIATSYLQLPFDGSYLQGFPASLREAAMPTLAAAKPPGFSEDSPLEPDW
ncbi:nucleotidyltransferase domain-containing protein [Mesorhizobium sp. VK25A]|uniref:Nucleotidyltransferase domain-containing protein n=1 Tax=Mesorhizobium vachelliae TaxID=3072309 RepID=A0ABU5A9I9_9HYPH|nr:MULTISPECIES: nucleotidyltransferase domain-containing protein [unclassified Mesorhizobium]MDX8534360.1 nucleotidyltransferase domain-containing protein [Mesorhizobium sp. VK25D]MDX8547002.1 nucleotidyltransferase domain-containing protein [Mesorhizobium sp. VK25A]